MADNTPNTNVVLYKRKGHFNIGMVLFGIIFVYLVSTVFIYLTTPRTTAYEVRMGSILNDTAYTGMAVRQETVAAAEQSGYVNYYSAEKAKAKVGTKIYVVSSAALEENLEPSSSDEEGSKKLTSDQQNYFGMLVQSFSDNFSDEMFADVYSFKDSIRSSISSISSANKETYLNQMLTNGTGGGLMVFTAPDDGIVVYNTDGYEGIAKEDVTADMFNKADYSVSEFYNNMQVSAGEPVYKLVTSEDWTLVVPLSEETAQILQEKNKKSIRVRFKKDNEILIAGLSIVEKDGQHFAYLSFSSSMIRYANERFLDVELIIEDQSGLKIPKSALTKKSFYTVPLEYMTQGAGSNEKGVMRQKGGMPEFLATTVYYSDENNAYLDPEVLAEGDVLLKPESNMTYIVGERKDIEGVFNINKGYAVFKQIKILCESDDYYIVESGNDYGLANYDRIALDSKNIKENDIIIQ